MEKQNIDTNKDLIVLVTTNFNLPELKDLGNYHKTRQLKAGFFYQLPKVIAIILMSNKTRDGSNG